MRHARTVVCALVAIAFAGPAVRADDSAAGPGGQTAPHEKKKKKAPAAAAPGSKSREDEPLPPLVPVPTPASPRVIEAYRPFDTAGAMAVQPNVAHAEGPVKRWRAALRFGAAIPRTQLGTGATAALDLGFILPTGGPEWLRDHLRFDVGFGWSLLTYQGLATIPGRGADPHFTENATVLPLSADLVLRGALGPEARGLSAYAGAGYARVLVRADFQSFSSPSHQEDDTNGLLLVAGLELAAGPGAAVLDVRYLEATANLGVLGAYGAAAMGALSLSLGYAIHL